MGMVYLCHLNKPKPWLLKKFSQKKWPPIYLIYANAVRNHSLAIRDSLAIG